MQQAALLLAELAQFLRSRLAELDTIPFEARDWRPHSHSNTISLIIRHLRIESEWHLLCLEDGRPMPTVSVVPDNNAINAVPVDFDTNLQTLIQLFARFCTLLETTSVEQIESRTATAYGGASRAIPAHFLAYHQLVHIATHLGQIATLHNLYRKSHGQTGLLPDNPTFPRSGPSDS